MALSSAPLLAPFDFRAALRLSVDERIQTCLHTVRQRHIDNGYLALCELPPITDSGATSAEISALEQGLGCVLPEDYRHLLSVCRYVVVAQGAALYGLADKGVYNCGPLYVVNNLLMPGRYLVMGDYWRFADGDQLLLALDKPAQPVMVYLHEHGPHMAYFAPTVTLALWRLVYEEAF